MNLSIPTLSFLRWLLLLAILVTLKIAPFASSVLSWILWISLGVLLLSVFFWPRCPHCGVTAVPLTKLGLLAGDACWRCGRPYDESRTPAYLLEFERAAKEALPLLKEDPEQFDRLLGDAGRRLETAQAAEKATLRERATVDPVAARTLRQRLKTELRSLTNSQKALRKKLETNPSAGESLRSLEVQTRALQSELDSIDLALPLLTRRK